MNGLSHTLVQVPPGVQCLVGAEARRRRSLEDRVVSVFEGWDYEEIIPPLYDYADVFAGPALSAKTYSFVGRDGGLLALRPDFTSLLAKLAAGRLAQRQPPIRLYYSGEVLRYEPPKAGRQSELYQMGLEHLGGSPPEADAETLVIAAECLEAVGVRGFVLTLGHVGVFGGLASEAGIEGVRLEALRDRVESKDASGVRAVLAGAPARVVEAFARLATLGGDSAVLKQAEAAFAFAPAAARSLAELGAVVGALRDAGLGERLAVDLGEVRGLDYYTGLVFRAYAPGLGFEIGSGGRYDALLARFGRPLPAVGFMLGLDRLALLLERQGTAPADAPRAEIVAGDGLTARLRRALALRKAGARIRLGGGAAR